MRVAASGRSAFVTRAQGNRARIAVNQPSDCLALQRDHIVCTEVDSIEVWFGYEFTSQINGPEQPESPEVWQTALHHLLNAYKPRYCYIYTGGTETGLGEEVNLDIETQGSYRGFWDDEQHVLSLTRWVYWILWTNRTRRPFINLFCFKYMITLHRKRYH